MFGATKLFWIPSQSFCLLLIWSAASWDWMASEQNAQAITFRSTGWIITGCDFLLQNDGCYIVFPFDYHHRYVKLSRSNLDSWKTLLSLCSQSMERTVCLCPSLWRRNTKCLLSVSSPLAFSTSVFSPLFHTAKFWFRDVSLCLDVAQWDTIAHRVKGTTLSFNALKLGLS